MNPTLRDTLLDEAYHLFLREGIDSNSQEQITAKLDVSPATFREMFRDKADLVLQVTQYDIARQKRVHAALFAQEPNAIKRLLSLLEIGIKDLRQVSPQYIADIQKYPEAWDLALDHLTNYSGPQMHQILNDGVLQKMIRGDINIGLVTKIILEMVNLLLNEQVFPPSRYSIAEVYRSIYLYYIRGLCTEEGIQAAAEHFSRM
ncbi:TetR/AcrR family transcriptional regulator [Hymenobacter busanensis]|uniref:TetR/AcrR family transcriptional regulator n=1 Tax=Hymenobacter busanensis TaxID=2607656 RepID=A0A7L4ZXI7_9BACT|nr:TetR family transcriptional regulator [Hymenobacter busanensis]KAA9333101.1 TetR/AcrR family transcriptional regulator [Hymenobacter busanensis]QHJ08224.1 TetR family transcriptional regulator [Hymenobacter busanensis]